MSQWPSGTVATDAVVSEAGSALQPTHRSPDSCQRTPRAEVLSKAPGYQKTDAGRLARWDITWSPAARVDGEISGSIEVLLASMVGSP